MAGRLSRRNLLATGGTLAAWTALPSGPASAERGVLFRDGFGNDTLSEYDVSFRPYDATDGTSEETSPGGAISWSPENEWATVESPVGGVAVIEPPVKPPETGHVHLRLDVIENNAATNKVAVRLVESDDSWVELAAMGDEDRFTIVENLGGGTASTAQFGRGAPVSGRHAADLFWGPNKRAVYSDGEFVAASSKSETTFDFTPRRIEFRNVQNDTRLRYWQLDERTPPDSSFRDLETPTVSDGSTSTEYRTSTDRPSDERTAVGESESRNEDESVEIQPPADVDDWLGGIASVLIPLVGVPIVGPVVLGGFLAASRAWEERSDRSNTETDD